MSFPLLLVRRSLRSSVSSAFISSLGTFAIISSMISYVPEQQLFLYVFMVLLFNGNQSVVDKVPPLGQSVQPVCTFIQTHDQIECTCMCVYRQYLTLRTFYPDSIAHHTHLDRICGMAHLATYNPISLFLGYAYCAVLPLCAFCLMLETGRCCRCDFQQSTDQHQYYQYSFHHVCGLIIQIILLLGQGSDEIVYFLPVYFCNWPAVLYFLPSLTITTRPFSTNLPSAES